MRNKDSLVVAVIKKLPEGYILKAEDIIWLDRAHIFWNWLRTLKSISYALRSAIQAHPNASWNPLHIMVALKKKRVKETVFSQPNLDWVFPEKQASKKIPKISVKKVIADSNKKKEKRDIYGMFITIIVVLIAHSFILLYLLSL